MKKIIIIILSFFLLTGCSKEVTTETTYILDQEYYQVYSPYLNGVGKNYIAYNENSNIDINDIETSLMRLSRDFFSSNTYYYQDGQYLTKEMLKELLNSDNLNKSEKVKINNKSITPKYITYIEEQNYLDIDGNLSGISIAISLNPYQTYSDSYTKIDENKVIDFGEAKARELLTYLRAVEGLEEVKIVIALYIQSSPNSAIAGNYKEVTLANANKIEEFKQVNEQYYILTSSQMKAADSLMYNNFSALEDDINSYLSNFTAISGEALYINNEAKMLNIKIYSNSANNLEILSLSQYVSEEIIKLFDSKLYTEIKIYNNYELASLITRSKNYYNPRIYILDR